MRESILRRTEMAIARVRVHIWMHYRNTKDAGSGLMVWQGQIIDESAMVLGYAESPRC